MLRFSLFPNLDQLPPPRFVHLFVTSRGSMGLFIAGKQDLHFLRVRGTSLPSPELNGKEHDNSTATIPDECPNLGRINGGTFQVMLRNSWFRSVRSDLPLCALINGGGTKQLPSPSGGGPANLRE